ncbi:TPA: hypothetical protein QCI66_003468 [Enterobacter cancerogenus]|nr:hypothetical protein [Enterobacter cancerogenus]
MNETMNKVVDAAKTVATEPVMKMVNQRLSNPFFLCFISSWILCNWERVLVLLFAFGQGVEQRIEKIKLIPSNSVFWGHSVPHTHTFWYPFAAAIFFVIGYPFVTWIVDLMQNGVIEKKNRNNSLRKQLELDSQMQIIAKQVQYQHSEEQEKLKAKKATKQIELDTKAIERNFGEHTRKLREVEKLLKDKEVEVENQSEQYEKIMSSIANVRVELEARKDELKALNGDIIRNQNTLDNIKKEISAKVMPGTLLTGLTTSPASSLHVRGDLALGKSISELGLNGLAVKSESKAPILKNEMNLYPDRNKKE